jgi:hydrogenase-4 component F
LFAGGIVAILGLPPFGLFVSEYALIRAGFAAGRPGLMATVMVLLGVGFVALLRHSNRMLYGRPPADIAPGEFGTWPIALLLVSASVLLVLGLTLPAPFENLLNQVVKVVTK